MAPLTVNFSGTASGGTGTYSYSWNFGDLSSGTGPSPSHVYSTPGDYTATLTVTDTASATATASASVQVTIGLTASATPTSGIAPLAVAFDGSASGGIFAYAYNWDFGDGTVAGPLAAAAMVHKYYLPGSYWATLSVKDAAAGTASVSIQITVDPPVPTVLSVSPATGPDSGGTPVVITGTYLMNLTGVTFGTAPVATAYLGVPVCDGVGACTVTVKSPAHSEGIVDVKVTTPGGTSPVGTDQFSYTYAWSLVTAPATVPSPREGAAIVNDGTGLLLFGGFSGATLLNDTWHYSGGTWTQIVTAPALTPAARANPSLGVSGSQVVLFGGACGLPAGTTTCLLNDTWTWDPVAQAWTPVQADAATPAAGQPTQRAGSMLATDTNSLQVLFGGRDATGFLNDTWTFNGTGWTAQAPTASPTARAFGSMATDALGQVVLFGGWTGTAVLGDTWTWNGSNWTLMTTLTAPAARKEAALAYFNKPNGGVDSGLALFGGRDGGGVDLGDTWTWNGTTWVLLYGAGPTQPAVRSNAAAASYGGAVVVFGGSSGANDLWQLS